MLQLLTTKPVLYVCNVEEEASATGNAQSERVRAMAEALEGKRVAIILSGGNIDAETLRHVVTNQV